jgi:adenosine kinase
MAAASYSLFCIGNPLLDIQVRNGEKLLKKYKLNANDAILATEEHRPMSVVQFLFHTLVTHSLLVMMK